MAQVEFLGCIREAATGHAQLTDGNLNVESKVCNFNVYLSIKQHVLWLKAPPVVVLHRGYQLLENALGLVLSHVAMVP